MRKSIIIIICVMVLFTGCKSSTAGYNYESARLQFSQKNYDKAQEYITSAIQTKPKAEYYILQAQIYYRLGKYDEGLKVIDKAITNKDDRGSLENNKYAYMIKSMLCSAIEDYANAEDCIDVASNIKELDDINDELAIYKMDCMYYDGKYDEVIALAEKFFDKYPKSEYMYMAYVNGARAHMGRGKENDEETANKYFKKALDLKAYEAHYFQGETFKLAKKYEQAYEAYDNYMKNISSDEKYGIYAKQIECLMALYEETNDESLIQKMDNIIKTGMTCENEEYVKIFIKEYIALLEKQGLYDEAFVEASEYKAKYPDDEAINKEIEFLETRIVSDNR